MGPKLIRWLGAAIVLGFLALVAAAALHDIIVGERDVRTEVITLLAIAFVVLGAVALKVMQSRRR